MIQLDCLAVGGLPTLQVAPLLEDIAKADVTVDEPMDKLEKSRIFSSW
jgi:hypothetical protein